MYSCQPSLLMCLVYGRLLILTIAFEKRCSTIFIQDSLAQVREGAAVHQVVAEAVQTNLAESEISPICSQDLKNYFTENWTTLADINQIDSWLAIYAVTD